MRDQRRRAGSQDRTDGRTEGRKGQERVSRYQSSNQAMFVREYADANEQLAAPSEVAAPGKINACMSFGINVSSISVSQPLLLLLARVLVMMMTR